MKKIFSIATITLLFFGINSCKKGYLDQVPADRITIEQVFAHKNTVDNFLANVYSYIRDEASQRYIGGSTSGGPWTGASDEAEYDWSFVFSNYMNVGAWGPTSGVVNDFWKNYYIGIRSATYFMAHVGETKEITNQANGAQLLARYIAEARALRAYYYFQLLKIFGPVVIIGDVVVAPDAPLGDVQLARSPYDSCVDYIASEFDKAAADLPDALFTSGDYGRMTRAVVTAYKAQMLLIAASPLYNGNSDYAALKNPSGTQLITQHYDATKWARAAAASKAFIDAYVPGTYRLYTATDGSGNLDPFVSCRDVVLKDWNVEWIFGKVGGDPGTRQYEGTPYHSGSDAAIRGSGGLGPTQEMVDAYFMDNGLSITDPGSGYVENGFSNTDGKYTTAGTYNMYTNREPRFYADITYNGRIWLNTTTTSGVVVTQTYYTGNSGKKVGSNDYSPTGYIIRKDIAQSYANNSRSWVMLRLAQIYLDYAEALNESASDNPDIAKYVNLIRERAGIPDLPANLSQSEMRLAIRKERRVELAFENARYFDTRRWKIAEQTDGGPFYGMDINAGTSLTDPAFYQRTIFETRVFTKQDYLWPIPQQELNVDKNLVQNTGW
ncbi:MAG: RagB/SusD family nutrient uptake outer membrane protein [Bacteroidota bacterium]|nr:RagB/SusD family nutrient uptake outer membrane protein [Bacteroidota bacterium]